MKEYNLMEQFLYKPYEGGIIITKCIIPEENIVIPKEIHGKKVKAIGDEAFIYDYEAFIIEDEEAEQIPLKIKKIHIPNTVEYISAKAFGNGQYYVDYIFCYELTEFSVDSENEYYCCENGVLYNKNKTELIQYPLGKKDKHFIVPDGCVKKFL